MMINSLNNLSLTDIGIKYGTDKATYHNFTEFYEEYFNHIRDKIESVLEIGIYTGSSLRMWKEYFFNAQIYGIDIDKNRLFKEDRIETYESSQIDFNRIYDIFNGKTIDIIIDDGSHIMSHQIKSFFYLRNFLKSGGFYIIEDLHTSYMYEFIDTKITTLDFLNNINKNQYNIDYIKIFRNPRKESITSIIKFK